nr:M23 family metallopeptidase [Tellurirhabdus bombi]
MMRWGSLLIAAWLVLVNTASSQTVVWTGTSAPSVDSLCLRFQQLYIQIREESIDPDSARQTFQDIMLGLRGRFQSGRSFRIDSVLRDSLTRQFGYFAFPVRGYEPNAIGGSRGSGYRGKGFDLFDYQVRGSHPAHDIFIADRNQDSVDDNSDLPTDVLSMSNGVVIGIETDWNPGQEYRGGNWVWVYDPILDGLFYYAHNNAVLVRPGQWVQAGDKLAEVGRTGYNAYQTRSPTHLHLMYLQLMPDGLPEPRNTYRWLLGAKTQ